MVKNPWSYFQNILAGLGQLQPGQPSVASGCPPTALPLASAALAVLQKDFCVFLVRDNETAERFAAELTWNLASGGQPEEVVFFPSLEVDPYKGLSPHPTVLEQRCLALWRLLEAQLRILVTSPPALLERLPQPEVFIAATVEVRLHSQFSLPALRSQLVQLGYKTEDPVTEVGEFAVRGGVLDIFPPSSANPLRIEFFGDFVDSIRTFDLDSQRSLTALEQATVIPLTHFPIEERSADRLVHEMENRFSGPTFAEAIAEIQEHLAAGVAPPGIEFLTPLLGRAGGNLLDYAGQHPVVVQLVSLPDPWPESLLAEQEKLWTAALAQGMPALPPLEHFHGAGELAARLAASPQVCFDELGPAAAECHCTPTNSFLGDFAGLARYLAATPEQVLFILSTDGRCERIRDLCLEYEIPHQWMTGFQWASLDAETKPRVLITTGPLERGFRLPDIATAVLGNEDIFPRPHRRGRAPRKSRFSEVSAFFSDLRDLKPGDFVVHVDHGVGLFRGLEKKLVGRTEHEFAHLEYADRDKLFVPVERMDLVQKFSGAESFHPPLDKLGGAAWGKSRARVKKALKDMAEELLRIYASRSVAEGVAFPTDDNWQHEFEGMFEFEETPDQARSITEVKHDLESARPMDRLLCGDVGYGKTEVAMRAAFKVATTGRQVAVLAPTTVLAFQHFNTFTARFASFPLRLDLLSRFRNPAQQKETLADLAAGKVDIVIGTHRLLSKDVCFHDLGLLIVDEEQRFGVTHKERIKKMRANIDVLTMSATPIPRTLYMSVMGIRDISVIETPPKDRLSIQTQVVRFSDDIIREAIHTELARQGQVYFVHNRVETIYDMAGRIRALVPEARLAIAHGQMPERELERVILDFVGYRCDVLLSTTIIENGIDIPLVNTIIINQAHRFGLAQLYQLRGRVGRSNRRAYAWLMVPSMDDLNEVARKRLAAIRDFTELGAGFRLAALDLEIRGAGNVLGAEQHGHINTVGFEMYCRLMEEAVREIRGEAFVPLEKLEISLQVRLRIPESYIADEGQRLQLYKRIASVGSVEQLRELQAEVGDRYGALPEVVDYLFQYADLRLLAQALNILSIRRRQETFTVQFTPDSRVDPEAIVAMVGKDREAAAFSPEGVLIFKTSFSTIPEMFQRLKKTLSDLAGGVKI